MPRSITTRSGAWCGRFSACGSHPWGVHRSAPRGTAV